MELFTEETQMLSMACMAEIERQLANGWSWGIIAKLLSRKWGVEMNSTELQSHYKRTKKQLDEEELARKRRHLMRYSVYWE